MLSVLDINSIMGRTPKIAFDAELYPLVEFEDDSKRTSFELVKMMYRVKKFFNLDVPGFGKYNYIYVTMMVRKFEETGHANGNVTLCIQHSKDEKIVHEAIKVFDNVALAYKFLVEHLVDHGDPEFVGNSIEL